MRINFGKSNLRRAGLSLVELVLGVALVSFLASSGIPLLRGIGGSTEDVRDRENARNLASLALGAQTSGIEVVDPSGSVEQTIRNLSSGAVVEGGAADGMTFRVPVGPLEVMGAARFLRVERGMLVYAGR